MKIALSCSGPDLNAEVVKDCHLAPYFLIVDSDTMNFEVVDHQQNVRGQDEEMQLADLLASYKPSLLLTGRCSDKAIRAFKRAGIHVLTGITGSVRAALNKYLSPVCAPRKKL